MDGDVLQIAVLPLERGLRSIGVEGRVAGIDRGAVEIGHHRPRLGIGEHDPAVVLTIAGARPLVGGIEELQHQLTIDRVRLDPAHRPAVVDGIEQFHDGRWSSTKRDGTNGCGILLAMGELEGRTIVVTGAASGLGRAFAEGFLADGAAVVATDINTDGLIPLADQGAVTARTDVSVDGEVRAMIDLAVSETGRIDVLINNAGYGSRTRVEDLGDGEFERMIAVHLFGCIYGMRAAIPVMRAQGYGRIINVISRAAEGAGPANAAYGAAKAAMYTATRSAAAEMGDDDILINMLFPGMTNTAIWGRDMPGMQSPDVVYPTAKLLATLPADGARGEVFYRGETYRMFAPENAELMQRDRDEVRRRTEPEAQR